MPGRNDPGRCLDQFRLALAENVTMPEAAARLDQRASDARRDAAIARHKEAMRRLNAKRYARPQ